MFRFFNKVQKLMYKDFYRIKIWKINKHHITSIFVHQSYKNFKIVKALLKVNFSKQDKAC